VGPAGRVRHVESTCPDLTDGLHVKSVGSGTPAIFVHGSFGWGAQTFPEQHTLADEYRVMLVDRRGFGGSASAESNGWPTDMHEVAELLEDEGPAHLVGQSSTTLAPMRSASTRHTAANSRPAASRPKTSGFHAPRARTLGNRADASTSNAIGASSGHVSRREASSRVRPVGAQPATRRAGGVQPPAAGGLGCLGRALGRRGRPALLNRENDSYK
jgi:pimeloyl-ACP methyl ester carboxylesterase